MHLNPPTEGEPEVTALLDIEELEVTYGRTLALRGLSLSVAAGEIVGVVGPNGAGKSTLMWAICGIKDVRRGAISFDGQSIARKRPHSRVRMGISLVPEGRRIFGSLTVEENMRLGMTAVVDGATRRSEAIEEMATLFPDLRPLLPLHAGQLSGGEQQQLAIARALLSKPKLLLLDEPSLGLAPMVTDRLFETLSELRAHGVTLLVVEQNAARAAELADRTYVLRSGSIVLQGTRDEVQQNAEFQAAYLGFGGAEEGAA